MAATDGFFDWKPKPQPDDFMHKIDVEMNKVRTNDQNLKKHHFNFMKSKTAPTQYHLNLFENEWRKQEQQIEIMLQNLQSQIEQAGHSNGITMMHHVTKLHTSIETLNQMKADMESNRKKFQNELDQKFNPTHNQPQSRAAKMFAGFGSPRTRPQHAAAAAAPPSAGGSGAAGAAGGSGGVSHEKEEQLQIQNIKRIIDSEGIIALEKDQKLSRKFENLNNLIYLTQNEITRFEKEASDQESQQHSLVRMLQDELNNRQNKQYPKYIAKLKSEMIILQRLLGLDEDRNKKNIKNLQAKLNTQNSKKGQRPATGAHNSPKRQQRQQPPQQPRKIEVHRDSFTPSVLHFERQRDPWVGVMPVQPPQQQQYRQQPMQPHSYGGYPGQNHSQPPHSQPAQQPWPVQHSPTGHGYPSGQMGWVQPYSSTGPPMGSYNNQQYDSMHSQSSLPTSFSAYHPNHSSQVSSEKSEFYTGSFPPYPNERFSHVDGIEFPDFSEDTLNNVVGLVSKTPPKAVNRQSQPYHILHVSSPAQSKSHPSNQLLLTNGTGGVHRPYVDPNRSFQDHENHSPLYLEGPTMSSTLPVHLK
jgi:hypothetical protein